MGKFEQVQNPSSSFCQHTPIFPILSLKLKEMMIPLTLGFYIDNKLKPKNWPPPFPLAGGEISTLDCLWVS